jgi:hypothetical protein
VIVRTWRAQIVSGKIGEYERFARTVSLPMFQALEGCEAVFFGREGLEVLVITIWGDPAAVEALAETPAYTETARRIEDDGLVRRGSSVEVFELHGRWAAARRGERPRPRMS